jgi:hypothetical protein
MQQTFKKTDFNDIYFVSLLEENGFDVYSEGGRLEPNYINGSIYKLTDSQYQILGETDAMISCNANTFASTLEDVEKRFGYRLFG